METTHSHHGHRDRARKLFLDMGGENLPDHQLLEILLYYAVPRKDTNNMAHDLLNTFGDIKGVLEADVDVLQQVKGIGYNAAVLMKLNLALFRSYLKAMHQTDRILNTTEKIGNYLIPIFMGKTDEEIYLMCFDDRFALTRCELISRGSTNSVFINKKKIVERAAISKANLVVVAHNHPGGIALPSDEDISATLSIHQALKGLHINLVDHLIVAGDDYISLKDSNMFIGL